MTEVIPGIYQLPLPIPNNPLGYINTYLIQGDNECLLIDTGWNTEEAFDSLQKQLAELGIGFKDISQIVITHCHPDHYGLAGRLKQVSNAKIALHYLDKDLIDTYINVDKYLYQLEQWEHINGVPPNEMLDYQTTYPEMKGCVVPILPDITLQGGETISIDSFSFQVLWTPGHSAGHICLYEPTQKILFAGDFILPTITPNISLDPQESGDNPLDDYLSSLSSVKQLDVNLILPAHENVFTHLRQRIEELIQHHTQRKSEIMETLKTEPKTAYQIATKMTWMADIDSANWQKLTLWDKTMAVLETLAHLESMRVDGKIGKFTKDGTICYQLI